MRFSSSVNRHLITCSALATHGDWGEFISQQLQQEAAPTCILHYLADALVLLLVPVIGINIHGQLPAHYTMISSALYQIRSQTIKAFLRSIPAV